MTHHLDRGQVTAEYSLGTLGAVCMAAVLIKLGGLGIDGPWLDRLWESVREALTWRSILDDFPRFGWRL